MTRFLGSAIFIRILVCIQGKSTFDEQPFSGFHQGDRVPLFARTKTGDIRSEECRKAIA
jgi:hypothetical protein